MRVYRGCLLALLFLILCLPVKAQEVALEQADSWGADVLESGMTKEAENLMEEYDLYNAPSFFQAMTDMIKDAVTHNEGNLRSAMAAMARVLIVIVLCQLTDIVCEDRTKSIALMTGVLAIAACCLSDLRTMIGLGRETMESISDYSSLLLPVMVSASIASGSLTGAGAIYMLATVFSNLLIRFCKSVLIPALYAYLALAITDTIMQHDRLKRIRELVGWGIEKGLKAVTYAFVGFLSITGLLTNSADTATLKAAKATIFRCGSGSWRYYFRCG